MSTGRPLLSFRGCLLNQNLFQNGTDDGKRQLLDWETISGKQLSAWRVLGVLSIQTSNFNKFTCYLYRETVSEITIPYKSACRLSFKAFISLAHHFFPPNLTDAKGFIQY